MQIRYFGPKFPALIIAGTTFIFAACNNSDYTKSGAKEPDSTSKSDTAMSHDNGGTAFTSVASGKKKGKVGVGTLPEKGNANPKPDKDGVYEITEVQPAYPGGHSALEEYINNNLEYQQAAIDDNTEGTVNVQFIVDENGKVTHPKVIGKELGNGLDEEATRVIAKMPNWEPGKVKGKKCKNKAYPADNL